MSNSKPIGSFLSKVLEHAYYPARKPGVINQFKPDLPALALICDPDSAGSLHLEQCIPSLALSYNLVLFLPDNNIHQTKIALKDCWKVYEFDRHEIVDPAARHLSGLLTRLPNLRAVLVDAEVGRYFMRDLWRNLIASVLFINQARVQSSHALDRILAYTTRVIYDTKQTFLQTLSDYLWAFPDSIHCLDALHLPEQERGEIAHTVKTIASITEQAHAQLLQQERDSRYLACSADFDVAYWTGKRKHVFRRLPLARRYIRDYKSGASAARPKPGFHPGVYAKHHNLGVERIDPFVHYLKAGKPNGPWTWTVLKTATTAKVDRTEQKIGLHIHAFYPEMLAPIIATLKTNSIRPDLFISIKDETERRLVEESLRNYEARIDIRAVPNRGRDIGPLLTEFGQELIGNYDIIGHLHTKQSVHRSNRSSVVKWNSFLLDNLLGDGKSMKTADTIVDYMVKNDKTALVFPDDRYAVGWARNYDAGCKIAERLGIDELPKYVVFPVGTMFWAKPTILKPFIDLDLKWSDYPQEPLDNDGTMLHAIERMFALVCYRQNLEIATTYIPGTAR